MSFSGAVENRSSTSPSTRHLCCAPWLAKSCTASPPTTCIHLDENGLFFNQYSLEWCYYKRLGGSRGKHPYIALYNEFWKHTWGYSMCEIPVDPENAWWIYPNYNAAMIGFQRANNIDAHEAGLISETTKICHFGRNVDWLNSS